MTKPHYFTNVSNHLNHSHYSKVKFKLQISWWGKQDEGKESRFARGDGVCICPDGCWHGNEDSERAKLKIPESNLSPSI